MSLIDRLEFAGWLEDLYDQLFHIGVSCLSRSQSCLIGRPGKRMGAEVTGSRAPSRGDGELRFTRSDLEEVAESQAWKS
jgi:hypothetical protein